MFGFLRGKKWKEGGKSTNVTSGIHGKSFREKAALWVCSGQVRLPRGGGSLAGRIFVFFFFLHVTETGLPWWSSG